MLPVLVSLASRPDQNEPTVVEGALDLANALLTPSTPQAAAEVHTLFSPTVMGLMHTQDDPGILQSCCEYLRSTSPPPSPFPEAQERPDFSHRAGLLALL